MAEAATLSRPAAAERRFLTFRVDGRLYALPAEAVAEVIRVPAAARLPQSPRSLLGLANLRGTVLPLVSLGIALGGEAGVASAGARAIVLDGASPVALAVDAVEALVSLGEGAIETREAQLAAAPGEHLRGAFKVGADAEVAKILDLDALLATAFSRKDRPARTALTAAASGQDLPAAGQAAEHQLLVTFEVAGQDYALALESVREIVPAPDNLTLVPRAEALLLGVSAYRDSLLPLLSLRGLLGFGPAAESDGREKVIVTAIGGVRVGLVADRAKAIVAADLDLIEPTPSMLAARSGGETQIKAIYRGDGGRRLVAVLSPEQLFREDVMQRLGQASGAAASGAEAGEAAGETAQFLVFRLGDEEFGLPIGAVDEVARVPETITRVPKTPKFLEGVINLRGEVLPVVDQRKRFDLPKFEGEGRRLVVVRTERHRAGLIVDSVSEVLTAAVAAIGAPPDLTGETTRLVNGVINLESSGRMVLLLDPAELLSRAERGLLDAFDAGAPGRAER